MIYSCLLCTRKSMHKWIYIYIYIHVSSKTKSARYHDAHCVELRFEVIFTISSVINSKNFYFGESQCFDIIKIRKISSYRSSHQRSIVKKGVLRNFVKFTRKRLCQSLWHRCFPVNFAKFLRTPFLQNTSVGCFWNSFRRLLP